MSATASLTPSFRARPRAMHPSRLGHRLTRLDSPCHAAPTSDDSGGTDGRGTTATAQVDLDLDWAAAPTDKDTLLMFAYGANLSPAALRSRGVSPSASAVGRAPGYRIGFQHRGGYASLDAVDDERNDGTTPGAAETTKQFGSSGTDEKREGAYGVVHRISRSELALVRRWEVGYETREVSVAIRRRASSADGRTADGRADVARGERLWDDETWVTATVFVTKPSARLRRPVPPFAEYHSRIMAGARAVDLPPHYVASLEEFGAGAVPKAERTAEYFDVGGTSGGFVFGIISAVVVGCAAFVGR